MLAKQFDSCCRNVKWKSIICKKFPNIYLCKQMFFKTNCLLLKRPPRYKSNPLLITVLKADVWKWSWSRSETGNYLGNSVKQWLLAGVVLGVERGPQFLSPLTISVWKEWKGCRVLCKSRRYQRAVIAPANQDPLCAPISQILPTGRGKEDSLLSRALPFIAPGTCFKKAFLRACSPCVCTCNPYMTPRLLHSL